MTKLQQRLIAHRRRKARLEALQKMTRKLLKIILTLVMLPAFIIYAVTFTDSLSYFTAATEKIFSLPNNINMFAMSMAPQTPPAVELYILGEDSLTVPSEAYYTVVLRENGQEITDFWHVWYPEQPAEGVTLTDTGLLIVDETATTEEITICVDVAGYTAAKTITLVYATEEEEAEGEETEEETEGEETGEEAGKTGEGSGDTGSGDTGSGDTGSGDTGSGDTGSGDTGSGDTGSGDTGSGDTGSGDTGSGDTGSGDAGSGDTGSGDTGSGDTGTDDGYQPGVTETEETDGSNSSEQTD